MNIILEAWKSMQMNQKDKIEMKKMIKDQIVT